MDIYAADYETALRVWNFKRLLTQKYDVVVTNPPYMGSSGMNGRLAQFVKDNYADSKSDLFAAYIEKCGELLNPAGYQAMITQHAWMFLSSYEKLRMKLMTRDIVNMAHLGARAFEEIGGEVVQTTAFVLSHRKNKGYKGTYARLVDFGSQSEKEMAFLSCEHRYTATSDNFAKIPGMPISYWASESLIRAFTKMPALKEISRARSGAKTGNNDLFLRYWWEINYYMLSTTTKSFSECENNLFRWFPHNKGGNAKNWYGNREFVINFENGGIRIKEYGERNSTSYDLSAKDVFFMQGITWTALTSAKNTFRFSPYGCIFDSNKGPMLFHTDERTIYYLLALLISPVSTVVFSLLNPTLSLQNGDVDKMPIASIHETDKIVFLSLRNIECAKADYDAFETSWDFKRHPLV